jgi:alcohol dehydrogenase class IV
MRSARRVAARCVDAADAVLTPEDRAAREDMALAACLGGLALANGGLGAVHGLAGPIGGMFPAPHGAVCARLLPPVLAVNLSALRERAADHPALARFDEVARLLTGRATASAEDGIAWIEQLVQDCAIPGLASYGVTEEHGPELIRKGAQASSMKGNPIPLRPEELQTILTRAM